MPELRSGPQRRRGAPVGRRISETPSPAAKYVKTRAAVAAAKKLEQEKPAVIVISEDQRKEKEEEEVEAGLMGGGDSGGLSANKGIPQEDEGNTTPFPERVGIQMITLFILMADIILLVIIHFYIQFFV